MFYFVVDCRFVLEDAQLGAGDVEDWALCMQRRRRGEEDILSNFDVLKMELLLCMVIEVVPQVELIRIPNNIV